MQHDDGRDGDEFEARAREQAEMLRARLEGGAEISPGELRSLVELAPDLVSVIGFDGHFHLLNAAWETTLGWTRAELRARPFIEFVHPDDRDKTATEAERLQSGLQLLSFTNRYVCRDGSPRTLVWRCFVSTTEQRYYCVTRDATDMLRARAGQSLLDALCEQSREAILAQSSDGRVTLWSGAGEALFGHAARDLVGQPVDRFLARAGDGAPTELLGLVKQLEAGGAAGDPAGPAEQDRLPATFLDRDGKRVPVTVAVALYGDGAVRVTGAVATLSPVAGRATR